MDKNSNNNQDQKINICPSCLKEINIEECEIFAKVACPYCENPIRVKSQIDRYILKKKIGYGGMSIVFEANDSFLDRTVALKIMNIPASVNGQGMSDNFIREANSTASLSHPNIVKVYSVGEALGKFFISMELIEGDTLEEIITKHKIHIQESDLVSFFIPICKALQHASEKGMIHRDIKPGNIILTKKKLSASYQTPKIVDFGLALIDNQIDNLDEMWATPHHVPPEKLLGIKEDKRSDIYSLGSTFYHTLTGKPPYDTDTDSVEKLIEIKKNPINIKKNLKNTNIKLSELLKKMLEPQMEKRISSYKKIINELEIINKEYSKEKKKKFEKDNPNLVKYKHNRQKTYLYTLIISVGVIIIFFSIHHLVTKQNLSETNVLVEQVEKNILVSSDKNTISNKFNKALKKLSLGHVLEANNELKKLEKTVEIQPTKNWLHLNSALTSLILSKNEDVKNSAIEINNYFSKTKTQKNNLDIFFDTISKYLSNNTKYNEIKNINLSKDYEMIINFFHAIKIWNLREYKRASELFAEFNNHKFITNLHFDKFYKKISLLFINDYKTLNSTPKITEIENWHKNLTKENITNKTNKIRDVLNKIKIKGQSNKELENKIKIATHQLDILKKIDAIKKTQKNNKIYKKEKVEIKQILRDIQSFYKPFDEKKALNFLNKQNFSSKKINDKLQDEIYFVKTASKYKDILLDRLSSITDLDKSGLFSLKTLELDTNGKIEKIEKGIIYIKESKGHLTYNIDTLKPKIYINIGKKIINYSLKMKINNNTSSTDSPSTDSLSSDTEKKLNTFIEAYTFYTYLHINNFIKSNEKNKIDRMINELSNPTPRFLRIWRNILAREYLNSF